jgi:hopanoid biosynthesis associated protein HpnK
MPAASFLSSSGGERQLRIRVPLERDACCKHNCANVKSLIVNGDDFGMSPEVNAGILRAHREGILTSASLMVTGAAAGEAVTAAKQHPGLDVGLHVVVCQGRSMLPPARLRGIVDEAGRFGDNATILGMRYFFDRGARERLRAECRAQVERHLELVGYLNHIDGHLNFHVHPVLADILIELAAEYRVPCIRLPREPVFTTLGLARDHLVRKLIEAAIFRALSARARRMMTERSLKSTDRLFGLHQSGHLSERYVRGVIERLPDGVTEIYFHPASDMDRGTPPSAAAQGEVEILTSGEIRETLARCGVRLMTYRELAADGSAAAPQ